MDESWASRCVVDFALEGCDVDPETVDRGGRSHREGGAPPGASSAPGVQRDVDLRVLPAHEHRGASVEGGLHEVARRSHRGVVGPEDHVASTQPGLVGYAAGFRGSTRETRVFDER